jgi:hypothetical protein
VVLSSNEEVLRRLGVSRTFGPTYPGDDLRYPGVWFSFEEDGLKGTPSQSDDRMKEVKRVLISQKGFESEERDALDEVVECSIMSGDVSRAVVKVRHFSSAQRPRVNYCFEVRDGVTLHFHPSPAEPVHIRIGKTTAQDLTVDLGPPLRTHYKEDERMTIHSTSQAANENSDTGCAINSFMYLSCLSKIYPTDFYNYFQHGIDFLISGRNHVVRKIILHSNIVSRLIFHLVHSLIP